jgi:hypothetical protein
MPIGRCLLVLASTLGLAVSGTAVAGAGAAPTAEKSTAVRAAPTFTPLKAPKPRWYTPRLDQRVLAASKQGKALPLPDRVTYPASGLAFRGIRPGSWIISPAGCTTNFVFGSRRNYFIGTAGHCARVGQTVTIVAAPGVLMNIGRVVKRVNRGVGNDFALIDVRPRMERHVNPSMTYFGGPTRAARPRVGDIVEHAGHGLVIGTGGTPRAGVVVYRGTGVRNRGRAFAWVGASSPGDSGSAVRRAGGAAVGNLTHLVVGGKFAPGDVAGTTIGRMLQIADRRLATAPNRPDPM